MLEAREQDFQPAPFETNTQLGMYAVDTSGALAELAVLVLGATDESSRKAARYVGEAWAVTGLLRALPVHLSQGWLTLPGDLLTKAGSSLEQVLDGQAPKAALAQVVAELASQARWSLAQARAAKPARAALPALLPATLARAHLRIIERAGWDVFDGAVIRPRPMPLRLAFNSLLGRF